MEKITGVNSIDTLKLHRILTSEKLTDKQKAEFIKKNTTALKNIVKTEINKYEFEELMSERPLIRFRPLKNSFTKKGDTIILAKSLGIAEKDIKKYINSIIENNFEIQDNLKKDNIEKVKTYVFRHGTKAQVVSFLEYELSDTKTTLKKLYKTLEENSGGLCDYFSRPIHRMDNKTLGKLYNTIDKSLRSAEKAGVISKAEMNSTAEWALVKIYQIQNNSKLLRAYEIYNTLT
ncbi:MAG: hypothetical protein ACLSWI_01760 [Candidatus Gastranaerophilaceae bacterium]